MYKPNSCWRVKSGKKKGKLLEGLMFDNYTWVRYMLDLLNAKLKEGSEKNNFHLRLEALLKRGEELEAVALCPQCEQRKVKYMSVLTSTSGMSAYPVFTCCENTECVDRLKWQATREPQFYPLKFSVIKRFKNKTDQGMIANVLKWAFKIEKLTEKELFKLFWEE